MGGQDAVRVAVEVLACPVVTHRGAWIGMAAGDLNVPQVHARVKHGRYEGAAEHVRVGLGDLHAGGFSQAPQAARGRVAVHPGVATVEQDRPAGAVPIAWSMARPTAGASGIRTTLVPLPHARSTR